MKSDKYMVFKSEEVEEALEYFRRNPHFREMLDALNERARVNDAVVIRTQDMFAAAGLSAYAHNIQLAIELWRGDGEYAPSSILDLRSTADYFMDCSHEAEDRLARGECKLPD